ncbi:MAG: nucleotidyltransferase domain-containing protein [Candidatus Anammoxibacter sp.]
MIKRLSDKFIILKLFGSRAIGNVKESSDIDIAVIFKEENYLTNDILAEISLDILLEYDINLEIVSYSLSEYRHYKELQSPFTLNVDRDGIEI